MARSNRHSKLLIAFVTVLLCAGVFVLTSQKAHAADYSEYNDIARGLLAEYYDPAYYLDTCEFNITKGYRNSSFADKDQLPLIKEKALEITAGCSTDQEKVRAIHDWIVTNIDYPEDTSGYTGYPHETLANPCTVFENRQAVCYGFSNLTELMTQSVGIPCLVVRGRSSTHVWNAVYLDRKWQFLDNTWDEGLTKENETSYRYYLMDDSMYDSTYRTEFIECWAGDACYFPVYVTPKYDYHTIWLDSKGSWMEKLPYCEVQDYILLPDLKPEGRTFYSWKSVDTDLAGYNLGAEYYYGGDNVKGITHDIHFKASFSKLTPEGYETELTVPAVEGQKLSDVELPEGYYWVNPDQIVGAAGTNYSYQAYYCPDEEEYARAYIDVTVLSKAAESEPDPEPIQILDEDFALTEADVIYSGREQNPAVITELPDGAYTVSYENNIEIGEGTVIITGQGDFTGTVEKHFSIVPGKAAIKSVTRGKKKLTVKAKALAGGVSYQFALKKKGAAEWRYYDSPSQVKTIKKLAKKKKYYVKVRAYKISHDVTYYGKFSGVRTYKTK
ncbi:MAG: transglutaminase domain-containing protein [Bacillota bacterium]|nr:transglutaminase domain-containing protein [Bacillota bacterium]